MSSAAVSISEVRDTEPSRHAVAAVALFSIVLVRVPVLVGHPRILHPLIVLAFLLCIAWAIPRSPRRVAMGGIFIVVMLYAGIVAVALLRGSQAGVYGSALTALAEGSLYVVLVLFGVTLVTSSRTHNEGRVRLICLASAPAVYAAVNLILHFAGVAADRNASSLLPAGTIGTPATLLGFIGIHATRIVFPLATSINLFSVSCAAGLAAGLILLFNVEGTPKKTVGALCVASAACLLLGDSRVPIAVSVAVVIFFVLNRRAAGSSGVALILPALPVIVVATISLLDNVGLSSLLSRNSAGTDLSTATGRTVIWHESWSVLKHPTIDELIGWGANGQLTSGASPHWAFLFRGVLKDPATAPAHNIAIQSVFDIGYLGLAVFVAAAALTAAELRRRIRREPSSPSVALLAAVAVILLCGATKVSPSYFAQEALVMMLIIMGVAAGMQARDISEAYDVPVVSEWTARGSRSLD